MAEFGVAVAFGFACLALAIFAAVNYGGRPIDSFTIIIILVLVVVLYFGLRLGSSAIEKREEQIKAGELKRTNYIPIVALPLVIFVYLTIFLIKTFSACLRGLRP